jgi:putative intracellular protease/amidase
MKINIMKMRLCYLFLFDGFADWEPSLVTSGLNTYSDFMISTFSIDGKKVKSMGNLHIKPNLKLEAITKTHFDLLILPGGKAWEEGRNTEILEFVKDTSDKGITIAGICAATTFLANMGIFDKVKHTSNGLEYLKKQAPKYDAERNYVNKPCVADKNVITANGAAMIEFAHMIFQHFEIFKQEELNYWLNLYKSGGMTY